MLFINVSWESKNNNNNNQKKKKQEGEKAKSTIRDTFSALQKAEKPAPLLFGVRLFIPTPQTWWSGTLVLTLIGRG